MTSVLTSVHGHIYIKPKMKKPKVEHIRGVPYLLQCKVYKCTLKDYK